MKERYRLFLRRKSVYYAFDTKTKRFESLKTRNKAEAQRLLMALNEAGRQPAMNLSLARVYLKHSDPMVSQRTWQHVWDEIARLKTGDTQHRWQTAAKDKAFDLIRSRLLIETQAEHFLDVLKAGTVSTNAYLRKTHNFALDMNWLPASIIPRRQWPAIRYKEKRAIKLEEHEQIIAAEVNAERKAFYQLCWHLGGSQGDIAHLKGEDIDWANNTVAFVRKKTGVPVLVHLGAEALHLLRDLPSEGFLFPYLAKVRPSDRATEFKQRCKQLKIQGVTLHSYRYAWAERARKAAENIDFWQQKIEATVTEYSIPRWFGGLTADELTVRQLLKLMLRTRNDYQTFCVQMAEQPKETNELLKISIVLKDGYEWAQAVNEAWSLSPNPNALSLSTNAQRLWEWAKSPKNTGEPIDQNMIGRQAKLQHSYQAIEAHLREIRSKADPTICWEYHESKSVWKQFIPITFAQSAPVYYTFGPLNPGLKLNPTEITFEEVSRFREWLYQEILKPGFPDGELVCRWRDKAGNQDDNQRKSFGKPTLPVYLKLRHTQSQVEVFSSSDGQNWGELRMSHTAAFAKGTRVGMFVTSGNTFATTTVAFDSVRVSQ